MYLPNVVCTNRKLRLCKYYNFSINNPYPFANKRHKVCKLFHFWPSKQQFKALKEKKLEHKTLSTQSTFMVEIEGKLVCM